MEWVKKSTGFGKRFAPNPYIISLSMGLGSLTWAMPTKEWEAANEGLGIFGGAVGLEANFKSPLFPGDTVYVIFEIKEGKQTSKGGTLVDWYYQLWNQRDELIVEFTERLYYLPKGTKAGATK
jgi:acyl dehydratase